MSNVSGDSMRRGGGMLQTGISSYALMWYVNVDFVRQGGEMLQNGITSDALMSDFNGDYFRREGEMLHDGSDGKSGGWLKEGLAARGVKEKLGKVGVLRANGNSPLSEKIPHTGDTNSLDQCG